MNLINYYNHIAHYEMVKKLRTRRFNIIKGAQLTCIDYLMKSSCISVITNFDVTGILKSITRQNLPSYVKKWRRRRLLDNSIRLFFSRFKNACRSAPSHILIFSMYLSLKWKSLFKHIYLLTKLNIYTHKSIRSI